MSSTIGINSHMAVDSEASRTTAQNRCPMSFAMMLNNVPTPILGPESKKENERTSSVSSASSTTSWDRGDDTYVSYQLPTPPPSNFSPTSTPKVSCQLPPLLHSLSQQQQVSSFLEFKKDTHVYQPSQELTTMDWQPQIQCQLPSMRSLQSPPHCPKPTPNSRGRQHHQPQRARLPVPIHPAPFRGGNMSSPPHEHASSTGMHQMHPALSPHSQHYQHSSPTMIYKLSPPSSEYHYPGFHAIQTALLPSRINSDSKPPHSNKAYEPPQVDYIRYHKEDLAMKWNDCLCSYRVYYDDCRLSDQCLSSRNYRDNKLPALDADWNPTFDADGKVIWVLAKVRERNTPSGKDMDAPHTLVEKHPHRAASYPWVREEDRRRARKIIRDDQLMAEKGTLSKKGKWRRAICIAEAKRM